MARWYDSLFGDLYSQRSNQQSVMYPTKPLWTTLLTEDEELIRRHILQLFRAFYYEQETRIQRMRYNLCAYVGLQYFEEDVRWEATEGLNPRLIGGTPKITSNQVQTLVNQQVTQSMLYPSDVSVIPIGTDFKSSLEAEAVKELLDTLEFQANQKRNLEIIQRRCRLFGESYRYIFWNKDKGDLHPSYKRQRRHGETVMVETQEGEFVEAKRAIYQGDVDEQLPYPWDVGVDPKSFIGNAEWMFIRSHRPVDEIRMDYPELEEEIMPTEWSAEWSTEMMRAMPLKDHCLWIEFFHRSTPYLPDGYYARLTPDAICEEGPNPYDDVPGSLLGNLPFERLSDLDVDGTLHAWSRLQNITGLQQQYDNATTLVARNIWLGAHPKWIMPMNACNIARLANKVTVVQYKGGVPPSLQTYQTVQPEVLQYRQDIKSDMRETYNVHEISLGEAPPGVTANAALQFLDTQQSEASSLWRLKNDQFVTDCFAKRLAVIAKNYDDSDERTAVILGEDRKWYTKVFDTSSLRKPVLLRMAVSSDLPQRKDARMQVVFQMSQIWPTLFPPEAIVDMFKLGHAEKFLDSGRAAWRSAEYENYRASKGERLEDPEEYQDLVVHWRSHRQQMQTIQFKDWPKKDQEELKIHQLATEYLMLTKARTNYIFLALLQNLPNWPDFLPLPPDFGRAAVSPQALPAPAGGEEAGPPGGGGAQKIGDAGVNQQRFPNGQFGEGMSAIPPQQPGV